MDPSIWTDSRLAAEREMWWNLVFLRGGLRGSELMSGSAGGFMIEGNDL